MFIARSQEPSARRSLHESIAHDIGRLIAGGVYREADPLPTEIALAERYGVSRTAVREAFRILAAKGMTVSRPKVGTRVRLRTDWNVFDMDVIGWHLETGVAGGFIQAAFELRALVEPEAAALAAARRSESHVRAFQAVIGNAQRLSTAASRRTREIAFVHLILEASGNPLFGGFAKLAEIVVDHAHGMAAAVDAAAQPPLVRHQSVVEAIRRGDAAEARAETAAIVAEARVAVEQGLASIAAIDGARSPGPSDSSGIGAATASRGLPRRDPIG